MNPGFILAVGLILAAALAILVAVARQGDAGVEDASGRYGHELEPRLRGRRDWTPARRQRAMVAVILAALVSIGAGMLSFLATAKH
jgi:hypothetical protein